MNLKGLKTLQLSAALFAGVLFLGDAVASTPQARRLSRQVSVEASQIYRTVDRNTRRQGPRVAQVLQDLRSLQDSARDFEMDISSNRPQRVQRSFDQLERATRNASRTIVSIRAYRLVSSQFRMLETNVNQLKREISRGGGQGQTVNVAPMARRYKNQIENVIMDIKRQIARPGNRRPRVRQAMQSLRQLKMEAQTFLQVAKSGVRKKRIKRAFEQLAQSHRMTRQQVSPILQRTGTGSSMRQASQIIRNIGQKLDRVGGGRGPIGGGFQDDFEDDFGSFPRF